MRQGEDTLYIVRKCLETKQNDKESGNAELIEQEAKNYSMEK